MKSMTAYKAKLNIYETSDKNIVSYKMAKWIDHVDGIFEN